MVPAISRRARFRALAALAAFAIGAAACSSSSSSSGDGERRGAGSDAPAKGGALLSAKLKIEGRRGSDVPSFSIKPKDDGAKLVDDRDKELARYKTDKSGFRIKGPDDVALAEIEIKGEEIRVIRGGTAVYELKRYPDGDLKLKDVAKTELFHIKKKDGASFEIEDGKGSRVAKVDVNAAGKTKVKDASGAEIWVGKDKVGAAALACLAFDGVDLPIRVGLLLAVDRLP